MKTLFYSSNPRSKKLLTIVVMPIIDELLPFVRIIIILDHFIVQHKHENCYSFDYSLKRLITTHSFFHSLSFMCQFFGIFNFNTLSHTL